MNKYLVIAVFVVLFISGLAIRMYGNARFAEGLASSQSANTTSTVQQGLDAIKDLEKNRNETKKIEDDGLDAVGAGLGILRRDTDY